jgi:hypothetical protein
MRAHCKAAHAGSIPAQASNIKYLGARRRLFLVRPAGRTCLEVKVLYPPGKGKG